MLRNITFAVLAAVGLLVFLFWFLFGTLSPCDALRAEYRLTDTGRRLGALVDAMRAYAAHS